MVTRRARTAPPDHDLTAVTVRAEEDGVVIRVEGPLDDLAGRALLDAVRVATTSGDAVAIELRSIDCFTYSAVRDLAACSHLGAELHFTGTGIGNGSASMTS
jgi:hypothetical protein